MEVFSVDMLKITTKQTRKLIILWAVLMSAIFLAVTITTGIPTSVGLIMTATPILISAVLIILSRPKKVRSSRGYEFKTEGASISSKTCFNIDFNELKERVALLESPKYTVRQVGEKSFDISRRLNISTWGSKIFISLTPIAPQQTQVAISSEPKLSAQIYDWGQGKRDIEDIFSKLESLPGQTK
ncbi:hypothetical protein [Kocuria tytonicola]|uniref:hypothetical protein n=1 Tax=Kocuria tytonicola TaxID=2055946 RepID=UPI000F51A096|nr:hypothetical protein [Kocuria tytonicola]